MAQFPVITAGTRITADLLSSMFDNYVIKPADTTRASTVTPTADPDLVTGTLSAGGVYAVEFHIRFAGLQAAGLRTQWLVPSGTTGNKDTLGPGSANAVQTDANTTEMRWAVHGYGTQVGYTNPRNSVSLQSHLVEKALVSVGSTAGTVSLAWAQFVSNATGSLVVANSYVKWRQVG